MNTLMNKQLVLCIAVGGLLAGCAGTGNEAPVEDRAGGRVSSSGQQAPIVDAGGGASQASKDAAPSAGVSTQGLSGAQIAESSQPGGKATGQVETRALPNQEPRVTPMQPATQASGGTADAGGAGLAPHGGGKDGATSLGAGMNLNDPGSPLAKRTIYFDYDSAALRDEYRAVLEAHASYIKSRPTSRVLLQGHADERGSREYNLALGQRRAEGVLQAFSLLGVSGEQMEAVSLGEEKPVAEGHDEASWQQNRRTEILYQSQ